MIVYILRRTATKSDRQTEKPLSSIGTISPKPMVAMVTSTKYAVVPMVSGAPTLSWNKFSKTYKTMSAANEM